MSRTSGRPVDGLLVVDKPAGPTSHDVVARVRRLAGTRRVGHAGTLDPMATGVLLVGVGRATRLLGHLALADKSYAATIRLGAATTTDDVEGDLVSQAPVGDLSEEQIRGALAGFVGALSQVPSSVSAVKVDGQRAHARVRAGQEVRLAPRDVVVHELRVDAVRASGELLEADVWLRCSTGTYVRAIARDLGRQLGVGGHLGALRRTSVGPVAGDEAVGLAELERVDPLPVVPMNAVASRFFPTATVDEDAARAVGFGRTLALDLAAEEPTAVLGPDGTFLALYRRGPVPGEARAMAVFVEPQSSSDRSTVSE